MSKEQVENLRTPTRMDGLRLKSLGLRQQTPGEEVPGERLNDPGKEEMVSRSAVSGAFCQSRVERFCF